MEEREKTTMVWATILIILITYHLMVFLHIGSHSLIAEIFGVGDIFSHKWSLTNLGEHVDYSKLIHVLPRGKLAIVAISGLVTNLVLFCVSWFIISCLSKNKWVYNFFFWFALMNLGEIFSYVPIRSFFHEDDLGRFLDVFHIERWIFFIPAFIIIVTMIMLFIRYELKRAYFHLHLTTVVSQRNFLFVVLFVLFIWFGAVGFFTPELPSRILSALSVITFFVLFLILKPPALKKKT